MANTPHRALQLAIEQAQRQRDACAKALMARRQQTAAAMQQLEQLQSYAAEMDARWARQGMAGVSVDWVTHQNQFMSRLQQATGMQEGVVAQMRRHEDTARQTLVQAEQRLTVLQKVWQQRQLQAQQQQARYEQKAMDEMAMQLSMRRLALNGEHV
ncbi:flagellar export protein FliJ [Curvibacter sp. CHRR-16]|uniref:flagellar export protein FliJ n=1 Tax=Curvibacter sp. CHRR-16 TaxID=2835872 RepID=UPI001BD9E07C|nr:flagellar export protein FliJ [Curvibacter sp. CHRR-16]MBT0569520.1 flagellar export protein FliJ [Curvibacter sp. CHRR-16]